MFLHTFFNSGSFYVIYVFFVVRIKPITCVSLNTPPCFKQLLLTQARYIHNVGNCWLSCGWMEILTLHSWKYYTHTHARVHTHTTVYSTHTSIYWDWRTVFRGNLHFSLHYIFFQALLLMRTVQFCDAVYCLTKHVVLNGWVKIEDTVLYHTINEFLEWDSLALTSYTSLCTF
jgi:hypothetical protein